jgi:transposase
MKRFPEIEEDAEELDRVLKKQTRVLLRNRIHALWLIKTGQVTTRKQIAELLRAHLQTVCGWLLTYEESGLNGLLDLHAPGPTKGQQRSIPQPAFEALKARLEGQGFDSYVQIQNWLRDEWAVDVRYKTVWKLVRKDLGAKLKRARPTHAKKKSKNQSDGSSDSG